MSNPSVGVRKLGQRKFSTPKIDKFAIVPVLACAFAMILFPILTYFAPPDLAQVASRPEPRVFWPVMAAISIFLWVQNRSRLSRLSWPPHIICLLVYLAFAGASVLWAYSPQSSLVRVVQQAMVVTSVVLPAMLAARTADMMYGLFVCFAFSLVLNLMFVFGGSVTIAQYGSQAVDIGYQGYFLGKNYLGECAAVALLLAFRETLCPGLRRAMGIIVIIFAVVLVFLSDSKTALGLALIAPLLAGLTLVVRRLTRISPAIILLSIPFGYFIVSSISNFSVNRISYMLYGDSTFTGRTVIWDFAQYEIARSPFVGWGYQSFWLVPNAPSVLDAPGWVKLMPNAHNGYYDTMLEMGYIGLALLLVFIVATLHAIGRVADRDPARGWLLLSMALLVVIWNLLESLWMRGFEFLWVVFLIVAVEAGRYWQPFPLRRVAHKPRSTKTGRPTPFPVAQTPRLRMGLS
jgi:exopolysaccharide production protein ExoQ